MEPVDLNDYYSGGYFLLRAGRPEWPQELLPPGHLISLSNHICPLRLNVAWGWIPGDREAPVKLGIPESRLEAFLEWCKAEYEESMAIWSMFYSPQAINTFIKRFDVPTDNLYIIGAGLPKALHQIWLDEVPDDEGIARQVKQGVPVEPMGKPLGYEVLSYSYHDMGCSWLCSHLYQMMFDLFGIRTNDYGLLDSYEDAKKINDWIGEEGYFGVRAEPEPYDFWLLLSYPIEL